MSWVVTAIVVGTVVVGGTAFGAYSSVTAAQQAKDDAKALAAKQKANEMETAFRLQKQRGILNADPGLRDTILTGPSGVTGSIGTGNAGGGKQLTGL